MGEAAGCDFAVAFLEFDADRSAAEADGAPSVELAEKALLKKLRTRSLSVSEARGVLREHDLDEAAVEGVIASMDEYGYLDDAALAEQLVHAGVDRKGQGRRLIAQTLAKRGIHSNGDCSDSSSSRSNRSMRMNRFG